MSDLWNGVGLYNINNLIHTNMITIDKINKTITVEEDITLTALNIEVIRGLHGENIDILRTYKIPATKKVTEYIPILQPAMPVNPYPYPYYPVYPSPPPYYPPYHITCNVKTNIT